MASYTISPIWGAGAQLFDDNGNPLSGGKLYVYAAGTTTPSTTYTDPSGVTPNANPIILNAAGRIAGEIWFTAGQSFKFVLKTSNDVLIATYDNIPSLPQPAFSNDASSISFNTGYVVTAGTFTVGATYQITSVGSTSFTSIGAASNTVGTVFTATGIGAGTGTAAYVRTVQAKERDIVSAKDFGATGNGVTDDSAAIQAAVDFVSAAGGGAVYFPAGVYACANIIAKNNVTLKGDSASSVTLLNNSPIYSAITTWTLAPGSLPPAITAYVNTAPRVTNFHVRDLTIDNQYDVHPDSGDDNHQHGVYLFKTSNCSVTNCVIKNTWYVGVESFFDCFDNLIADNTFINVGNRATIVAPTGFYYGVGVDNGATRCVVRSNYFNNCGHAVNKIVDFFHSEDCVIEGNTFGRLEGLFLTHRNGGKRLIVRNNTGDTCGSSLISITADPGNQLGGGYCENPTIVGNSCNDFNTLNGASVAGIIVQANGHKTVIGNRVRHAVTSALRGCIGVNLNGPAPGGSCSSQVQNNYFEGNFPNYQAIRFNAGEANFVEALNVISGATEGVFVDVSATNGKICFGTKFINVTNRTNNASTSTRNFGFRQSYTPVFSAVSGGFSLGNGSVSGDYQVLSNDTVEVEVTFSVGSTTNFGSGALLCTLPINSDASERVGSFFLDNGASSRTGISRVRSDGKVDFFVPTQVSGSSPVSISATAVLKFSLVYKI